MSTSTPTRFPFLFRLPLLLAGLLLAGLVSQAQTTWTGSASTDWATAQNWSTQAVPTATDDVIIPSGPSNQPTLSTAGAVANNVEVQSGARLTIASTGTLTINGFRIINGFSTGFFNNGMVENSGQLALGTTASVGRVGLYNVGTFTNQSGGQVAIDRATTFGLWNNSGTFTNAGGVTIGATVGGGAVGLENRSTFTNQSGGQVAIDRAITFGLLNSSGTFTNAGGITIGAIASVGSNGLVNRSTFTNQSGGQVAIDRATTFGLWNNSGTFTNAGGVTIGATVGGGAVGLENRSTFTNQSGGQVAIDRAITFGLLNSSGTFTNAGGITIGAIASVGSLGLRNEGTFNNNGCTALLRVVADAAIFNDGGTITNSGQMVENATGTSNITSNSGLVQNLGGGTFTIGTDTGTLTTTAGTIWTGCTSTDWATALNWSTQAVPTATDDVIIPSGPSNQPTLSSAGAVARSVEVQSGAKLTIASTGTLTINGFRTINGFSTGFFNNGTVENSGQLALGTTASVGAYGIFNDGTFTNHGGGQLAIDRVTRIGLRNFSGTFTNVGGITIGANHSVGNEGLENTSTFTNQSGGQIAIDRASFAGLRNFSGTFTNAGSITIGAIASVGSAGIENRSTFTNQSGGQIAIDRTRNGLVNFSGSGPFTNAGRITIGATSSVGNYGLYNESTFNNSGCTALLNIVADAVIVNNEGTITNSGQMVENASGTSNITSNTGIVVNQNGGTFTVGDGPNQPLSLVATNATQCSPPNGSLQLTGLKASTPYTLRYTLNGGSPTLLSPDSTSTASGTLTIPGLGAGTYALTLSGSCLPLPIQLEATLTGPSPVAIQSLTPSQFVCAATDVTLTVAATGATAYQWYRYVNGKNDQLLAGATSASVTVNPTTSASYYVVVTGGCGAVQSDLVKLTLKAPTVLLTSGNPSAVCRGASVTLTVGATGPGPLSFAWRKGSANGPLVSTTHSLTIQNAQPEDAGPYFVSVTSECTTQTVQLPLTVRSVTITQQPPASVNLCSGNTTLTVGVQAVGVTPTYQWRRNGQNLFGATSASLVVSASRPGSYTVVVGSVCGSSVVSEAAVVGCNPGRGSAEEAQLVVAPNPVRGSEIRVRVSGMHSPEFTLFDGLGRSLAVRLREGVHPGAFTLNPVNRLAGGVYLLQASEGPVRVNQRVVVVD